MPDWRAEATRKVETEAISKIQGARQLTGNELAAHGRGFGSGWELPGLLASDRYRLRLLLPDRFPFSRPRVAVYPIQQLLAWPHLERNGLLCLVPDESPHSPENPGAAVVNALGRARTLANDSLAGERFDQFEDEFATYWDHWAEAKKVVRSLCRPEGTSRWVSVWYGETMTAIAEGPGQLRDWLDRFTGGHLTNKNFNPQRLPFLWLKTAPRPHQYPTTVARLRELVAGDTRATLMIDELLLDDSIKNKHVLFACRTRSGVGLGAARILNPATPKGGGNPLTRGGFRGQIPKAVLLPRYMSAKVIGASVIRSDAAWVHGRDHNDDVGLFLNKSAVVLGNGSIGSPVATLLAQAAVGRMDLVDPQLLESENTGRHELGATSVRRSKATELAATLGRRFPHLTISGHTKTWQEVMDQNLELLAAADLIVSAIGSWQPESELNAFAFTRAKFPPMIFGWTEPHAVAGHAVAFMDRTLCLRCLTDDIGEVRIPVTCWKQETMKPVPACGGSFQPYGAVELAHIYAMVAELALDALTGRVRASCHRVWIGRRALLQRVGGEWNPRWVKVYGDPQEGGCMVEPAIAGDPRCPICKDVA